MSAARTSLEQGGEARRGSSASNRGRYQPREAVADSKTDNSDLIDFIRQGPPGAGNSHRIPRHVAPFRNTMDSDQFNAAIGGRAVDALIPEIRHSQASTSVTENSMPSIQSSVNSSSALLKSKNSPAPTSHAFGEEDMMPKRKTRRVRDPYAIDFSDEEDDIDMIAPVKAPPKKEESLAEFLRNYQPPPEPEPPAVLHKAPKKKASAPSLIGRFTRSSSSKDASNHAAQQSAANESRSLSSRVGPKSAHIPIQVNIPSGYDAYGQATTSQTPQNSSGSATPSRRVPMKKFEPREAVSSPSTRTSDLASFLRDSAPPDDPKTSPSRTSFPAEEANGLSKMFGRRKKTPLY